MIHTSAGFVTSYDITSTEFLWGNFFDGLSRIGVPLFVMVSGALMLDENRKISMKKIITKNVKGLVILLALWSLFYDLVFQVISPLIMGEAINVKSFVLKFFYGHYHMWYLYMMIGLYLITPYLRCFVSYEKRNMVLFFIGISLLVQLTSPVIKEFSSIWSPLTYISTFINKFQMQFFCGYAVYYLTGWYIVHVGFDKKIIKYGIYTVGILSAIITILYVRLTGDYNNAYSNMNIFVFLYSIGVFCALVDLKISADQKKENIIETMSRLTFGVYILHPLLLVIFKKIMPFTKLPMLYIVLIWGITCCSSFVLCYIASKKRIVKKLIRM
jgi:surface polysaccharide O-acyltransferase-like enzyme